MKKILIVGIVAMLLLLNIASSTAVAAPETIYNAKFDGYCDGVQLRIPSAGIGVAPTVDGHRTGCMSQPVLGSNSATFAGYSFDSSYHFYMIIKQSPRTWALYRDGGGGTMLLANSGTWTSGVFAAGSTGGPRTDGP